MLFLRRKWFLSLICEKITTFAPTNSKNMNSSTPLVSVIIPSFNHGIYIAKRIDTVLAQTYQNIEVFILDDCSTDNSREIISSYEGRPRVKEIVFNEQNTGNTFIQWERGVKKAKGEYVWIAESDDYTDPTFLEKVMAKIVKYPNVVLGFSRSTFVDQLGNELPLNMDVPRLYKNDGFYNGMKFGVERMVRYNRLYNASMVVFRRDCFSRVNPVYKKLRRSGDWAFWACVCTMGNVVEVPERLNYFRQHTNKVSFSGMQDEGFRETLEICRLTNKIFGLSYYQFRILKGLNLKILRRLELISYKTREELRKQYPEFFEAPEQDIILYKVDKALGHISGIH